MKKLLVVAVSVFLLSCSTEEPATEKTEVYNPNGDSELALAMRSIFDQTEEIKASLRDGKLVIPEGYIENLRSFHSATPTDPEVKVTEFFGFVKAIEIVAQKLEESEDVEVQRVQYAQLVNTCIQCHQQFCPGPIRRIKKLTLPKMQ